jgi:hypothetical protein
MKDDTAISYFGYKCTVCGLCRRYTILRTPSNAGGLIVRRIVWPIFNPRTTDVEHPTFALDHVPAVVGILDRVKGLLPNV